MVRPEGLRRCLANYWIVQKSSVAPPLLPQLFFWDRLSATKALDPHPCPHHPDGMYQEVPLQHHEDLAGLLNSALRSRKSRLYHVSQKHNIWCHKMFSRIATKTCGKSSQRFENSQLESVDRVHQVCGIPRARKTVSQISSLQFFDFIVFIGIWSFWRKNLVEWIADKRRSLFSFSSDRWWSWQEC